MNHGPARAIRWLTAGRGIAASLVLASLAACHSLDDLLSVESPSIVADDNLNDPTTADLQARSVTANFGCALSSQVMVSGIVGNELESTVDNLISNYDRRTVFPANQMYSLTNCDASDELGIYRPLSKARWQADDYIRRLEGWTDAEVADRAAFSAQALAHAGYSLVLMGETFCSAALDGGPELTSAQLFQAADTRFTAALALAQGSGNADTRNLALVGRARARLNLHQNAGALADAQAVAVDFVHNAIHSDVAFRTQNRISVFNYRTPALISVAPEYRGLTFGGVADPRVVVTNTGTLGRDLTPVWGQAKYRTPSDPVPFARSAEARLIVAEIQGGQPAVDIINALHAAAGIPPFSSTDAAAIRAQVIEERKRELFLEGQHIGDVQRYGIPLVPAPGSAYPKTGGGTYGSQTCLPLPDAERLNNPNLQ